MSGAAGRRRIWMPEAAANLKYDIDYLDSTYTFSDTAGTTQITGGGTIARANDKSSAGLLTTGIQQATAGNRPTWTALNANVANRNTFTSATSGASGKVLQALTFAGSATIAQPWSIVLICYNNSGTTNTGVMADAGAGEAGYLKSEAGTGNAVVYFGAGGAGTLCTTGVSALGLHVWVIIGNGGSSKLRKDGVNLTLTGTPGTSALDGYTDGDNYLGPAAGYVGSTLRRFCIAEDVVSTGLITAISGMTQGLVGLSA